jgi:hypothetical protein
VEKPLGYQTKWKGRRITMRTLRYKLQAEKPSVRYAAGWGDVRFFPEMSR